MIILINCSLAKDFSWIHHAEKSKAPCDEQTAQGAWGIIKVADDCIFCLH